MLDIYQKITYNVIRYEEVRCFHCHALLGKVKNRIIGELEVKCSRCKQINIIRFH